MLSFGHAIYTWEGLEVMKDNTVHEQASCNIPADNMNGAECLRACETGNAVTVRHTRG